MLVAAAPLVLRARVTVRRPAEHLAAQVPRRIASLSPSTTELCAALGLMDRLVARSTFCDWPPLVARVTDVGGLLDPNLQRLVLLRPDLVLLPGNSLLLRNAIASTDLRAVALPDSTLDDVFASLRTLGTLTGRGDHADTVISRIRSDLATAKSESRPLSPRRVLMVVEAQPPIQQAFVAGPGSYLDTLLKMAGHVNAMSALDTPWAEVSAETLARTQADVILDFRPMPVGGGRVGATTQDDAPATDADAVLAVKAWSRYDMLPAVRNHRVYVIRGQHHVVPGPRVSRTLRMLMKVLAE